MARQDDLHECIQALKASREADLFPLPLSPFEKFVLWDETTAEPMTSFIELHFASVPDRHLLQDAFTLAAQAHPLVSSRVIERDGELFWEPEASGKQELIWLRPGDQVDRSSLDIFRRNGVRLWMQEHADGTAVLVAQLHHACCDGVGFRLFLIDALTYYARNSSESAEVKPNWNRHRPALLKDRFDFRESGGGSTTSKISNWQRLKNAYYFHFQTPAPLKGSGAVEELNSRVNASPLTHRVLSREISDRILLSLRNQELGVNDLAIALLFRTCCHWNREHGEYGHGERIRLLMAYDLRSRMDLRMPATNRLSFSFLGRTYSQTNDRQSLIQTVRQEIKDIKNTSLPLDFVNALEQGVKRPRLMRWLMQRSGNMATAAITYTGDISRGMQKLFPDEGGKRRVGDAQITNVLVAPPYRRNTNISLGLCINWGQLCISAAHNPNAFSQADCEQFLDSYVNEWTDWLNCQTPVSKVADPVA